MDDIHYREYKILLRPERFFDPHQFEVYWHKLCLIAPEFKVAATTNKDGFKRQVREVLFYDTPDYALYRNAFILRKRTFYTDGWPDHEHELTLKFRHPELNAAAEVDVTPRLSGRADIKFKEELLPLKDSLGGMRSLYSHNCVLMTPGLVLDEGLGRITQVFPELADHCPADKASTISLVNNLPVEEVQVNVGSFDFGHGLIAKATISVWRDRTTETSIIGEFAFQAKFDRYDDLHIKARARSEEFFKAAQTRAPEWVKLGATKTALVYNFGKQLVASHEG
ncbi:Uncharacterised protein [Starkeya nomas]|uniref:VTC domain-containing protein n=2 Tax=Xanthobacteraceae TaxID=335928 RepID=A0A5S9Q3J0_9HYPH|nr:MULTISPECIES: hypothetical protein [Xanthobacteraceae]TSJ64362.1 hypothetical protein FO470_03495 [Ancylobacter moscoviensis]CAA0111819.1 Uncharacterised protein [Starkeya nomas]